MRKWLKSDYVVSGSFVASGALVSAIVRFALNDWTGAVTVFGIFLGGGMALFGVVWWDKRKTRENNRRVLNSLRKSILRQLNSPWRPTFLQNIINNTIAELNFPTPPAPIVHLEEALQIAATSDAMDDLYTWLTEIKKSLAHLSFLASVLPIVLTSPWGDADTDIAGQEDGRPSQSVDEARQYWRFMRQRIWAEAEMETYRKYLREVMERAVPQLESALQSYGQVEFLPPSELQQLTFPQPFAPLLHITSAPYTQSSVTDAIAIATTLWSKFKNDATTHSK
ncbi:MAG: hypothetical protein C7B46_18830 [Sulfobacillus benefaciens]|uniref:Uncharacterized protein n=1 Tax=Sulfobacillus benefaciens TaxID=453960 RepID=A0A2T2X393_9FIRM|nr:MAG: hypothetical protein C7B46_18830 [Sulfobacillus benefaciens]